MTIVFQLSKIAPPPDEPRASLQYDTKSTADIFKSSSLYFRKLYFLMLLGLISEKSIYTRPKNFYSSVVLKVEPIVEKRLGNFSITKKYKLSSYQL